jgi:bifunctional non-homologous end joining protein LigD
MPSEARPVVAGVAISHADRRVFPAVGATKVDVAHYYESIADWVLPHLIDRPLTLVRCPTGAGTDRSPGECFFMKHSKVWAPVPIRRVRIREKTKVGEYLIADSIDAVVGLVQMGVLEIHTWNSRFRDVERPDRVVIDLDPGGRVEWLTVVEAARFVRATLARLQPYLYTTRFAKSGRDAQILVDYLRNNRTNTSIAAYSTRAKSLAPVSVPLTWLELSGRRTPDRWTMTSVPARLDRLRRDPWAAYWTTRQQIPRGAVEALDRLR